MKITKVICSKGRTGFFFDDQRAIKKGAVSDQMLMNLIGLMKIIGNLLTTLLTEEKIGRASCRERV